MSCTAASQRHSHREAMYWMSLGCDIFVHECSGSAYFTISILRYAPHKTVLIFCASTRGTVRCVCLFDIHLFTYLCIHCMCVHVRSCHLVPLEASGHAVGVDAQRMPLHCVWRALLGWISVPGGCMKAGRSISGHLYYTMLKCYSNLY